MDFLKNAMRSQQLIPFGRGTALCHSKSLHGGSCMQSCGEQKAAHTPAQVWRLIWRLSLECQYEAMCLSFQQQAAGKPLPGVTHPHPAPSARAPGKHPCTALPQRATSPAKVGTADIYETGQWIAAERAFYEQGLHLVSSWGHLLPGSTLDSIPARHITKHLLKTTIVKSCCNLSRRAGDSYWSKV